ncbi:hypothetical protein Mnod_0547 [Methylobacterium nodulans ORS 2060]|uniref:Uncharacterized protein n=1 Tax=Methylobacterium nodulans (strain LMG 21967 / CNCM I-2342 / ORS 2060) TaxID=460265 RepID=B8IDL3_METNO|nr:hypothetical protein Mnod_0547 [Methylobacterium nodulans ORS 2060]
MRSTTSASSSRGTGVSLRSNNVPLHKLFPSIYAIHIAHTHLVNAVEVTPIVHRLSPPTSRLYRPSLAWRFREARKPMYGTRRARHGRTGRARHRGKARTSRVRLPHEECDTQHLEAAMYSKRPSKLIFGTLLATPFISLVAVAEQCPQSGEESGPARPASPSVLVRFSQWFIRHGITQERYTFHASGAYEYVRAAGETVRAWEDGSYTVKSDHLILSPEGGRPRTICWRIGTYTGEGYRPILWLSTPDGREEHFSPTMP